jgi:hypothetical protein
MILHETDNLALIEQTAEKSKYTIFDTQSFVLPEPTKITNKDKTTTEVFTAKEVEKAYENAKHDNVFYIGFEKSIYKQLFASFGFVAFLFILIGSLVGYWLRDPIDGYDFKTLRANTKQEVDQAWEEARKAQETAKNTQIEALKQARAELEHEKNQAEYQKKEAEKERRAAIQLSQKAHEELQMMEELRQSRTAAIVAADRRKNQIAKQKEIIKLLKSKLVAE